MDLNDKNIVVTGGTGFLGSHIVNQLINLQSRIKIITLNDQFDWRIKNNGNCEFFYLNIQNYSKLKKLMDKIKPDFIFHLAAYVNPEDDFNLIEKMITANYMGTKNLLFSLHNYDYELFINTGTSDEYGGLIAPFKENQREKPISPYSASKVAATYLCEMIAYTYNKPIITVRPSLMYGPTQISKSLIPSLIYAGITNKTLSLTACEQTRDFLYVTDLANAYIELAKNAKMVKNKGIYNIGSGKQLPILKIVNLIKDQFPNAQFLIGDKPYRSGEAMNFYLSVEKIRSEIDWRPKWNIEDGIKATIKWWLENEDLWIRFKKLME